MFHPGRFVRGSKPARAYQGILPDDEAKPFSREFVRKYMTACAGTTIKLKIFTAFHGGAVAPIARATDGHACATLSGGSGREREALMDEIEGEARNRQLRDGLKRLHRHLQIVHAGIVVAAAALHHQNVERDEEIARVLEHCVGERLFRQMERAAELIAVTRRISHGASGTRPGRRE